MTRTTANRAGRNRARCRRGQALVPVIFVMLILTVVGVAFSVAAHRSAQASGNFVAQTQRFYAARGALNYAMSALAQTSGNGSTYGIVPALPDTDANGWAQLGDAWVKIETIDTGACINLNTVTQATLQKIPVFQDNPDLAAAVIQWRTPQTGQTGATGGTSTGGTTAGASSSSASSSASSGTDPYQSLSPPYSIKGANYDSVEELLLVQGMTPTLLYGTPAGTPILAQDAENAKASGATTNGTTGTSNTSSMSSKVGSASRSAGITRQAAVRPTTTGTTGATGAGTGATGTAGAGAAATAEDFTDIYTDSTTALAQMFTTTSRERNLATDGTLRLNVNTATAQDMQTQLGLTAAQAQAVIRFRTGGQTGGQAATPARPTLPNAPAPAAPRTPARGAEAYEQRSRQAGAAAPTAMGAAGGTAARTPATGAGATGGGGAGGAGGAQTTTFKTIADLLETTAFTRTVMQRVADRVSIDDKAFHENVVNINTAPAEVLATVPGMTHTILNAILTYRQGGQTFQDLGDLFTLQDLQRTDFQAIMASLTTRTTTYYVHIKVRTAAQQGIYAVSALVEMADNGPHLLQWRETERAPGWSTWLTPPTLATPTPGQNLSGMTNAPSK